MTQHRWPTANALARACTAAAADPTGRIRKEQSVIEIELVEAGKLTLRTWAVLQLVGKVRRSKAPQHHRERLLYLARRWKALWQ